MFDPLKDVRKTWSKSRRENKGEDIQRKERSEKEQIKSMRAIYGSNYADLLSIKEKGACVHKHVIPYVEGLYKCKDCNAVLRKKK